MSIKLYRSVSCRSERIHYCSVLWITCQLFIFIQIFEKTKSSFFKYFYKIISLVFCLEFFSIMNDNYKFKQSIIFQYVDLGQISSSVIKLGFAMLLNGNLLKVKLTTSFHKMASLTIVENILETFLPTFHISD